MYPSCFLNWGRWEVYLIYLLLYLRGPDIGIVLNYPWYLSPFTALSYIELITFFLMANHQWRPGMYQHSPIKWCSEHMFMKQWPALGQRDILQFIWMLARGHTTRPLSTYQLCLRS